VSRLALRAELLTRLGRWPEARQSDGRAIALTTDPAALAFL
jgi:predicted RNA polymerase sigma factor